MRRMQACICHMPCATRSHSHAHDQCLPFSPATAHRPAAPLQKAAAHWPATLPSARPLPTYRAPPVRAKRPCQTDPAAAATAARCGRRGHARAAAPPRRRRARSRPAEAAATAGAGGRAIARRRRRAGRLGPGGWQQRVRGATIAAAPSRALRPKSQR
eukprot:365192-Chlamydomonas_euryale.AAC.7